MPPVDPHAVVDRVFREEQGRAVATLIRVLGDFDLAEEAVQDAFVTALETWPVARRARQPRRVDHDDGPQPGDRPAAAPAAAPAEKEELLTRDAAIEAELAGRSTRTRPSKGRPSMSPIADDRLRLIFTCCHPALAMDARVALTLRTLGGLSTPEIARAFLVPEPTLAQRLVRAKRKIRDAGHPVPRPAGPRPAGAARRRAAGRSTSSSTRATTRRRATARSGASCAPRRSGWPGSSRR